MHWACIGHALVDQVIAPTSVTVFQQLFPSSNSRSSSAYHMPRPFLLRTSPAFDVARLPGVVVLVSSSSFVVCRSLFVVRSFVRSFVRCCHPSTRCAGDSPTSLSVLPITSLISNATHSTLCSFIRLRIIPYIISLTHIHPQSLVNSVRYYHNNTLCEQLTHSINQSVEYSRS